MRVKMDEFQNSLFLRGWLRDPFNFLGRVFLNKWPCCCSCRKVKIYTLIHYPSPSCHLPPPPCLTTWCWRWCWPSRGQCPPGRAGIWGWPCVCQRGPPPLGQASCQCWVSWNSCHPYTVRHLECLDTPLKANQSQASLVPSHMLHIHDITS